MLVLGITALLSLDSYFLFLKQSWPLGKSSPENICAYTASTIAVGLLLLLCFLPVNL
jgi:hypothetical protein